MTTTLTSLPDDPFKAFQDAVVRSQERLRRRRVGELTDLLVTLDRQRRHAQDELVQLNCGRRGGGEM